MNKSERKKIRKFIKEFPSAFKKIPIDFRLFLEERSKEIERKSNLPEKSKDLCKGCNSNWYNYNRANLCYSYSSGKVTKKMIHPYLHSTDKDRIEIFTLDCYIRDYKSQVPYQNVVKNKND